MRNPSNADAAIATPSAICADPAWSTWQDLPISLVHRRGVSKAEANMPRAVNAPGLFLLDNVTLVMISQDPSLSRSREPLLREAGLLVQNLSDNALDDEASPGPFRVAIFCQTLSLARALLLANIFRKRVPNLVTMRLTCHPLQEEGSFTRLLEAPITPHRFVQEAKALRKYTEGSASVFNPA